MLIRSQQVNTARKADREMTLRSLSIERNAVSPKLSSPKDVACTSPVRSPRINRTNSSKKMADNKSGGNAVLERSLSFKNWGTAEAADVRHASVERCINGARPGKLAVRSHKNKGTASPKPAQPVPEFCSPRPRSELDEAATKLQKIYKGHRTRRSMADCAIVIEELWWKLYDSASLDLKSISFFHVEKQETAASRWGRAMKRIAKVGKGLLNDEKAQKLAIRHWLEAIDPRHRYGHNLHLYYVIWLVSESTEPFFYWLDVGVGRDIVHEKCPRSKLNSQLIMYLGTNERAAYEVIAEEGRLLYRQSGVLVNTTEDSKWIFVLSTTRSLYVGQKKKGRFQHSSFLAGGATTAAGRLVAEQGVLKAIWPYSGHYLPTEENFREFISFLEENNVDLANVKRCAVDDDEYPSFNKPPDEPPAEVEQATEEVVNNEALQTEGPEVDIVKEVVADEGKLAGAAPELAARPSFKWTTRMGARIGCVREYPVDLQCMALEQVNLSPRLVPSPSVNKVPIPSPRPSPGQRLSPRLRYMGLPTPTGSRIPVPSPRPSPSVRRSPKMQCMGIPTPTVSLTLPKHKGK